MFPILLKLGPITIYSYGFFIAIGYLACIFTGVRLGKKDNISGALLADLGFYLLLAGFVGARLLFVFTTFSYFWENPLEIFYVWQGGLVFYGGLILSTLFCIWYIRKHQLPLWRTLDIASVAVPLAHAFGRLGCFAAGCCHGSACNLPWAVRMYSEHVQDNLRGVPIHPVQLYEAGLLFLLSGFLYWKWHHRKFAGQITMLYFILYSVIRSITEIYRGDTIRGFVVSDFISTSQFISILLISVTLFIYWRILKKQSS